ncbi:GNAT superfamily N-acetyltransferase [Kitasatospora gansuensis]|uniref:GNAT superfamily N-acetyltransferase n=1 Tax=Kitasatospora gansuensis TaxID=258050 RepID=A0A7W7S632_9ACTN|nr:GNAT family N-acetyltransferase [Kitasatospora gansuensis]MBB4944586.1 GNAT superfamily N-acetyltransferase [Kitasatospora gansuensis]
MHDLEAPSPTTAARVRSARPADLPLLVELAAEHAAYERAAPPAPDLAERLDALLFGAPVPRLHCLLAELPDGELVGYAAAAPELSTWQGREYLHLDCLFLRPAARGAGLGVLLMDAVAGLAGQLGLAEVQWQTPDWNEGAARFYDRIGARARPKLRYSLAVGP